jgi:hypothetical protein
MNKKTIIFRSLDEGKVGVGVRLDELHVFVLPALMVNDLAEAIASYIEKARPFNLEATGGEIATPHTD